ncbi:SDR family NAD(P)-dependent oxidoreductase [Lactococcus termiticola]|uniref:Short chain dehydrogenase n=1 Tax=Lactococcus termiticola TaxID=2169526 RepID=A0A2R5HH54_9LACT|nr:SDR family oxidoreductase [Lactococcus termiticola]GBG97397.1 short chain dehydrogenase [Lactococcus termiticola]
MEYTLITGASSGIGLALARIFARKKENLILVSSRPERLEKAKSELEKGPHGELLTLAYDLSQSENCQLLFDEIQAKNIFVSTLINNAGFGLAGGIDEIDLLEKQELVHLNVEATSLLCKLFIKEMYQKGRGNILNLASTGAFQPGPYTASYFASKAFVLNYSLGIRYEAKAHGVNVSCLCPGATKTDFFKREGKKAPAGAMSAEAVAHYAYRKMMKGKAVIVPGFQNQLIRYLPRTLKMHQVAKMKQ